MAVGSALRSDRGSASVWLLGVGLAVVAYAVLVQELGVAVVARHRAESAADLGALAGAVRAVDGPEAACARAERIIVANGARLASCRLDGLDVIVAVEVDVSGGLWSARATARAGPIRAAGGTPAGPV